MDAADIKLTQDQIAIRAADIDLVRRAARRNALRSLFGLAPKPYTAPATPWAK